jgi:hypothetical protein
MDGEWEGHLGWFEEGCQSMDGCGFCGIACLSVRLFCVRLLGAGWWCCIVVVVWFKSPLLEYFGNASEVLAKLVFGCVCVGFRFIFWRKRRDKKDRSTTRTFVLWLRELFFFF